MERANICPVSKLDRILLATDRSECSGGAVQEAVNLSKACATRLYVMSVLETNPEYETIGASAYQKEENEALRYLEAIKSRAYGEGLHSCEAFLTYGNEPYQSIVEAASEKNVNMIIIGRHGRSGVLKVLMGQTAAKVIGHATCTVLVVPKAAHVEYKKILIATDGSEHSVAAAGEAIGIAKQCASKMVIVSAANSESDLAEAKANVHAVTEAARNEGIEVETVTPIGKSHDVILETAGGRSVDLIVMGTYGKAGFKKLFMGSSTEKVIGHANCAVMVVRAR